MFDREMKFSIFFGVDAYSACPMGVFSASITSKSSDIHTQFHVFACDISLERKINIKKDDSNAKIEHHEIHDGFIETLSSLESPARISQAAFLRLLIPVRLVNYIDKTLYLEVDAFLFQSYQ